MRLTAFTPAPPTPTTRSTGSVTFVPDGMRVGRALRLGVAAHRRGGGAGSRSRMFSGMSGEKTERRRSSGEGTPS